MIAFVNECVSSVGIIIILIGSKYPLVSNGPQSSLNQTSLLPLLNLPLLSFQFSFPQDSKRQKSPTSNRRDCQTTGSRKKMKQMAAKKTRRKKMPQRLISGSQHHTMVCNKGNVYVLGLKEYGLVENILEEPCTPRRIPTLMSPPAPFARLQ